jgi:hypothetical protein
LPVLASSSAKRCSAGGRDIQKLMLVADPKPGRGDFFVPNKLTFVFEAPGAVHAGLARIGLESPPRIGENHRTTSRRIKRSGDSRLGRNLRLLRGKIGARFSGPQPLCGLFDFGGGESNEFVRRGLFAEARAIRLALHLFVWEATGSRSRSPAAQAASLLTVSPVSVTASTSIVRHR